MDNEEKLIYADVLTGLGLASLGWYINDPMPAVVGGVYSFYFFIKSFRYFFKGGKRKTKHFYNLSPDLQERIMESNYERKM